MLSPRQSRRKAIFWFRLEPAASFTFKLNLTVIIDGTAVCAGQNSGPFYDNVRYTNKFAQKQEYGCGRSAIASTFLLANPPGRLAITDTKWPHP